MNFLNRALKNVTRKLSKSILLAVTFFLIGNLVIVGMGISQASDNAKKLTRGKMKPVVMYEVDNDKYYKHVNKLTPEEQEEAYKNYPQIKFEDVLKIAKSEYVETMNYTMETQGMSSGFEAIAPEKNEDMGGPRVSYDMAGNEVPYVEPNLMIVGNYLPDMIELKDGTFEMKEGRFYSQQDVDDHKPVVVIEEQLAALNNLKIGDAITVDLASWGKEMYTEMDTTMTFEIIGIYKSNKVISENESWMMQQAYMIPSNKLLVPSNAILDKMFEMSLVNYNYYKNQYPDDYKDSEEPTMEKMMERGNAIFLLKDPLNVDKFVSENQSLLKDYQRLNANDDLFNKFAKPLDTISLFSDIIVWIVVLNAVVIISLVTALTLKTREYEIGVLMSVGVTKMKIVAQLFLELVIVAVLGFTLAVVSGSLMAKSIGKTVLDYQVTANEKEATNDNGYSWSSGQDYFTEITQDDMLSGYSVDISPMLIAQIYIIGIGVVFISILIPSVMIMRYNPKRILMNTN